MIRNIDDGVELTLEAITRIERIINSVQEAVNIQIANNSTYNADIPLIITFRSFDAMSDVGDPDSDNNALIGNIAHGSFS